MPLRDYECQNCGLEFTDCLIASGEEFKCPGCQTVLAPRLSFAANYTIAGDNSSSVRPRKSRSTEN